MDQPITAAVPQAVTSDSLWNLLRSMAEAGLTPPSKHPFYAGRLDHARVPKGVKAKPMLKFVCLVTRPPRVSPEDFHRLWLEEHSQLATSLANDLGMKRYVQSHVVHSPLLDSFGEGRAWPANPFTGMTEVWFESEQAMTKAFLSEKGQIASQLLAEDEKRSVDGNALVWLSREYEIFNFID